MLKNLKKTKVVIIGSGPAGISAAIYLKKENIDFVILEYSAPGGKVNIAPRVDNYPDHFQISGPDLAFKLYERMIKEGIKLSAEEVLSVDKKDDNFIVTTDQNVYESAAVLVASGTKEKKLGLVNEDELFGHGVSYCAICDGHFFKDQDVAIIGGGNSALKEAIFLAPLVKKLYLIHRRNEFRGLKKTLNELITFKNVEIMTPYKPLEIIGSDKLESLKLENLETNEILDLKINGLFPLIGQNPNTKFIKLPEALDEYKYIPVDNKTMMSSVVGLFAAGDVLPRVIKQIYLSEHDGKRAAKNVIEYLKGGK
ncbi:MAG: FAD-dependent oxidoreductase [Erysipelotrichaceae bacterium]|jgi:thioredoxin reductase (NADPH)|nr:FAD-dependent oxidoreductase [Erysipelotrichaceae bacterium]